MLSAGYCHLLAGSLRQLAFIGHFPMATFLAALGFLATLVSDQVVHSISHSAAHVASGSEPADSKPAGARRAQHCHRQTDDSEGADDEEAVLGAVDLEMTTAPAGGRPGSKQRCRYTENTPLLSFQQQEHTTAPLVGAAAIVAAAGMPSQSGAGDAPPVSMLAGAPSSGTNGHHYHHHHVHVHSSHGGTAAGRLPGACATQGPPPEALEAQSSGHFDMLLAPGTHRLHFATALLLAAALCMHSVLEGMALGTQQTMRATQDIMVAIMAHKGLAAYALGSSVVESGADLKRFWTVALTFALATPVAIFVGFALSEVSNGTGSAVLSALASGTFLYVAVMEVMPRELSGPQAHGDSTAMRVAKVAMLLLGFGLMSLLAIWA